MSYTSSHLVHNCLSDLIYCLLPLAILLQEHRPSYCSSFKENFFLSHIITFVFPSVVCATLLDSFFCNTFSIMIFKLILPVDGVL